LRPKVLGQLAADAGVGVQPLPRDRRQGNAQAGDAAAGGKDRRPAADRGSRSVCPLHQGTAPAPVTVVRNMTDFGRLILITGLLTQAGTLVAQQTASAPAARITATGPADLTH